MRRRPDDSRPPPARAGASVNVIDKPKFCDFNFGAIVNRSPLVIGISTDGASPIFGQAIRAKLEAMIPRGFAQWVEAARRWRRDVQTSGLSFNGRRRFWQLLTNDAMRRPNDQPIEADFARLLDAAKSEGVAVEQGSVTLVGAGPGDAELLTLRAVRALQSADIILFDDLVSPEVLDFARREAKKMLVGKTGHGPSCRQSEINTLMVELARAGKRVVRLKGGDPMIFGRAGEEIEACRSAGIAIEVVPGITAAQGAASRLGDFADAAKRRAPRAIRHRPCRRGRIAAAISTGEPGRSFGHHRGLHAGEDAGRTCRDRDWPWPRSGNAGGRRVARAHEPMKPRSLRRSPICRRDLMKPGCPAPCW